jgi:nitrogen regulatory protein PII
MYMIFFVLHDVLVLDDILKAWEETGVNGVTLLPSTGLGRLRQKTGLRDDLPLIPRLEDIFQHTELHNRTLVTIVTDDEMVNRVVSATQSIVGDLDLPNTGILAVIPLARVYGLNRSIGNFYDEDSSD